MKNCIYDLCRYVYSKIWARMYRALKKLKAAALVVDLWLTRCNTFKIFHRFVLLLTRWKVKYLSKFPNSLTKYNVKIHGLPVDCDRTCREVTSLAQKGPSFVYGIAREAFSGTLLDFYLITWVATAYHSPTDTISDVYRCLFCTITFEREVRMLQIKWYLPKPSLRSEQSLSSGLIHILLDKLVLGRNNTYTYIKRIKIQVIFLFTNTL